MQDRRKSTGLFPVRPSARTPRRLAFAATIGYHQFFDRFDRPRTLVTLSENPEKYIADSGAEHVRVRFAPSPTGYLHVGGARTALFNWLFARNRRGAFILRVEDTDVERNRPELVEGILNGLHWLGLDWDEGPFFQSQRLAGYAAAADKLLAAGAAYLCYCPPEKYAGGDAADDPAAAKSEIRRIVRCACREGKPSTADQNPAVRFRVPLGTATRFEDAVFGPREVQNDEIEDFVLMRSARSASGGPALPTYQLGAVVDDVDMRITHVIRGADHISNTPETDFALPRSRRPASCLCACSAHPGRRPHPPLQTPRRHQRKLLSRRRLPA